MARYCSSRNCSDSSARRRSVMSRTNASTRRLPAICARLSVISCHIRRPSRCLAAPLEAHRRVAGLGLLDAGDGLGQRVRRLIGAQVAHVHTRSASRGWPNISAALGLTSTIAPVSQSWMKMASSFASKIAR
jgi:hypothetical protein